MKGGWPSATARRLGLSGEIDFSKCRVGLTLHVPCARGHIVDVDVPANLHPNGVAKMMVNHGWTIGSKPVCPEHSRKKKEKPPMASTDQGSREPTDAAKKAHRLVMMALEDYYDEHNKRYKPGYSDAKIAEETGASEAHVKRTREDYFGPLGKPAELEAVAHELSALKASAEATFQQLRDQIGNAESRIARVCNINGWPVE